MIVPKNMLGIDMGSTSLSVVEISPKGSLVKTTTACHNGQCDLHLKKVLKTYDMTRISAIAATASTPSSVNVTKRIDNQVAIMTAVRRFYPNVRSILMIGSEKFGLITLDALGNYQSFRANSGCAAGTGSFLDQQAIRLQLKDAAELSRLAQKNTGSIPKIASRCSVFAKTDLVHAQQEGYLLEEICDGLSRGLAKNVVDVLFSGEMPSGPILFTGGVSKNLAVAGHIETLIGQKLLIAAYPMEALGAALSLVSQKELPFKVQSLTIEDIVTPNVFEKELCQDSIELVYSPYPEFTTENSYVESRWDALNPVEVDIYEAWEGRMASDYRLELNLGLDIGSTSTKAVLMTLDGRVLAGFYTRTAGRPVGAVQNVLAAIDHLNERAFADFTIAGVATTGSGRKLVGRIVGADVILDEISAHAKAAVSLNPSVDTIIEIGGQDSKFTTLKNGRVTFSVMNAVCAAGTGSFIEEQAQKLGCSLNDIALRTYRRRSPLASDRCTVFMERDINHYLLKGYAVDEVLAAVLHSVVENYLNKVAIESSMGDAITFQGATAKNKSLVAVMERRLEKSISVSKFCHLTGAMGAALALKEQRVANTGFKGLNLYKQGIPIRSEVCDLCTSHCKITVATVEGKDTAYGFLCGRDYEIKKRVRRNPLGFDLLAARRRAFHVPVLEKPSSDLTIGIPPALHLWEDIPMWRHFFTTLGIHTITRSKFKNAVKTGKKLAGAEFCTPMLSLHGHTSELYPRCDFIFLPVYLEKKTSPKPLKRQYCYYTQFAPSVVTGLYGDDGKKKILTPLIHYLYNEFFIRVELYRMLNTHAGLSISFLEIAAAFDSAVKFKQQALEGLKKVYQDQKDGMHVVLLGRPYAVLDTSMNKGILDIFGGLGVKTFYQDMLSITPEDHKTLAPLNAKIHWHYGAMILEAANAAARSDSAYPVLITAFKCTPDSFIIDYFKKIMAAYDKPFLILQLDDHDSNVGYETRIESAVLSFKGHYDSKVPERGPVYMPSLFPKQAGQLNEKTLLFPNWDETAQRLVIANLQKEGFDARLLEGDDILMRKSMRYNTGQCTPLNIIAQEFIHYVETHDLDPERSVLWVVAATIACNIGLYAHQIQNILNDYGRGLQHARVYTGPLSMADISMKLPINTYLAYMFGGLLKKMACGIRPYEKVPGTTDQVLRKSIVLLEGAFRWRRSKEKALAEVIHWFEGIEQKKKDPLNPRPKVALFGDLYVRDNELINQDLIHFIEDKGGEVVTTPYSAYVKMLAQPYLRKWFVEGKYLSALSSKALIATITHLEKVYYKYFQRILKEPEPVYDEPPERILSMYGIRIENNGESMENILKIHYLKKDHPDISLFVQTSPAFCCPSLITEAMAARIEKVTQTPMVSITYDGAGGGKNELVTPYLAFPRKKRDVTGDLNRISV